MHALNAEQFLLRRYAAISERNSTKLVETSVYFGILSGVGFVGIYLITGLVLYIAVILIVEKVSQVEELITTFGIFYFTGKYLANIMLYMPDAAVAKVAAASLFKILDAEDEQ